MPEFSEQSIKRITNTVLAYERASKNTITSGRRGRGVFGNNGFWAKLKYGDGTGTDTPSSNGKYGWVRVTHQNFSVIEDLSSSANHDDDEGFAVEMKFASRYCIPGDIVYLTPAISEDDVFYYTFEYNPGILIVTASGSSGVSASSGTTPGTGSNFVVLRYANNSLSGGSILIKVFNPFGLSMTTNGTSKKWIAMYGEGVWWTTGVECTA